MLVHSLVFAVIAMMTVLIFSESFRRSLSIWFFESKNRLSLLPTIILLFYSVITVQNGTWQFREFLLLGIYFSLPVFIFWRRAGRHSAASLLDVVLVLLVWFPQEFELVAVDWASLNKLPVPVGVFVTVIFLLILLTNRQSIELHCPGSMRMTDLAAMGIAYVALLAIIVPIGTIVNFIALGLNHRFFDNPFDLIFLFFAIFLAVALPEELLFRGWIQNLLMTRLKFLPGLLTAAVIFGLSHLDNKVETSTHTFNMPNWWYAFFATFAGLAYGFVYQKRKSLFTSALLHTVVDFTWVIFFAG